MFWSKMSTLVYHRLIKNLNFPNRQIVSHLLRKQFHLTNGEHLYISFRYSCHRTTFEQNVDFYLHSQFGVTVNMNGRIRKHRTKCNVILPLCCVTFPYRFVFRVNITYINKDGERTGIKGKVGDNILYLAHRYNISMEGERTPCCHPCG